MLSKWLTTRSITEQKLSLIIDHNPSQPDSKSDGVDVKVKYPGIQPICWDSQTTQMFLYKFRHSVQEQRYGLFLHRTRPLDRHQVLHHQVH